MPLRILLLHSLMLALPNGGASAKPTAAHLPVALVDVGITEWRLALLWRQLIPPRQVALVDVGITEWRNSGGDASAGVC